MEGEHEVNGELVVPGDTRCINWPRSCAEVQKQCATAFQFCDFCLYGPPVSHERPSENAITLEEAERRIAESNRAQGEQLRRAVETLVASPSSSSKTGTEQGGQQ